MMNRWVIDIETNGLLENMIDFSSFPYKLLDTARLWCVVLRNIDTNEIRNAILEGVTREWMVENTADIDYLMGHNAFKFDFLALRLFGVFDYQVGYPGQPDKLFGKDIELVDTLILSRLYNPDRYLGHSLKAWGERGKATAKIDFRTLCITKGVITSQAPSGAEFQQWIPEMLDYCRGDTLTTKDVWLSLLTEKEGNKGWDKAIRVEHKLADLAVKREHFGFYFDKELAIELMADLSKKIDDITNAINPILPPRKLNKGEQAKATPVTRQVTANGELCQALINWVDRYEGLEISGHGVEYYLSVFGMRDKLPVERADLPPTTKQLKSSDGMPTKVLLKAIEAMDGAELVIEPANYAFEYKGNTFPIPYHEPLETTIKGTIDKLDHVKAYLIDLGWEPTEWKERDLTKDAKKQNLPYEKRIEAMTRWYQETIEGKYTRQRVEALECPIEDFLTVYAEKLEKDKPVRVLTSPCVRVGVEKELCPNLVKKGEKVAFAADFALYLTYKHRRNSIAGGDIEDMDFDEEVPNTGYLSRYREADKRIGTPSIEIGASTNRYKHIGVANIPRASSVYGKEMRSLFGCGAGFYQLGFDFSSLENRVAGHYVMRYPELGGNELAETMRAEKPNDLHSVTAIKLGLSRDDCKSVNYACLYGAQAAKLAKMLSWTIPKAKKLHEDFWNSMPALKQLKENLEASWEKNGKNFIVSIDGRRINTRSQHSLLNALFQSTGVICTKYTTVYMFEELEKSGLCIDPFTAKPDCISMIEYHDECQLALNKKLLEPMFFDTKDEAKAYIKEWKSAGQISDATELKNGKFCVMLPNIVTKAIDTAIKRTEKELKLRLNLGFAWSVSNNWYGCH